MAFKSVKVYNEERYGGMFLLRNDGDSADVVFLYRNEDDVLVADTHYIKSSDYTGYVHCCGRGCPACGKGIRVQTKLFIPLYVISINSENVDEVQFFDRSIRFESQLEQDVFSKFPNPSEYVFRITRHGSAGDVNTYYQITAVGKNSKFKYDDVLASKRIKMPDYYETICKDFSVSKLTQLLNSGSSDSGSSESLPSYQVSPRSVVGSQDTDILDNIATQSNSNLNSENYDTSQSSEDVGVDVVTLTMSDEEFANIDDVKF